mmetsp:Transcript_87638/g.246171  ORF Transcript_87638/g.246171 Transcript_87638/m.246171 type:complete len:136 (+) Transcript_87638:84-491(+)|eukprot:CAMPEP_0117460086 /NCGR_PEP_ID=MMETSP0784-20121206/1816_1 /TAXON_ID=39447 /ORGANISM="" /LENGTH=135 /DNA_ID=CAMNT_0005253727 /DNA_START=14 /DNA_END=421 /DNA_ORIENTATION=-
MSCFIGVQVSCCGQRRHHSFEHASSGDAIVHLPEFETRAPDCKARGDARAVEVDDAGASIASGSHMDREKALDDDIATLHMEHNASSTEMPGCNHDAVRFSHTGMKLLSPYSHWIHHLDTKSRCLNEAGAFPRVE